jgi:amino acid transporter
MDQLNYAKQKALDAIEEEQKHAEQQEMAHDSYGELASFTMGKRYGPLVVDGALIISFLGAEALYIITITQLCGEVFPSIPHIYFTLFSTIFLLPFALARDLTWLNSATILATIAYGIGFIIIFMYGFELHTKNAPAAHHHDVLYHVRGINWWVGDIGSIMTAFGILAFSLDIPTMVFIFEEEMREPKKFIKTMNITMTIVAIVFMIIGILGVLLFHNSPTGVMNIIH